MDHKEIIINDFISRHKSSPKFIDRYNNLVAYLECPDLWEKTGKVNPFLVDDVSIALLFKANMEL